jgi:hypothetical protein
MFSQIVGKLSFLCEGFIAETTDRVSDKLLSGATDCGGLGKANLPHAFIFKHVAPRRFSLAHSVLWLVA